VQAASSAVNEIIVMSAQCSRARGFKGSNKRRAGKVHFGSGVGNGRHLPANHIAHGSFHSRKSKFDWLFEAVGVERRLHRIVGSLAALGWQAVRPLLLCLAPLALALIQSAPQCVLLFWTFVCS
jgi:hypothetical protein